jgi:isopenicillin-N epimerase
MAINTIMRSLELQPGDEILTTNHEYGAMDRTWNFYCKKSGAKYIRQHISLPIVSKEQILDEFWKGHTPKTKVIFLNQISSDCLDFPGKGNLRKSKIIGFNHHHRRRSCSGSHRSGHHRARPRFLHRNLAQMDVGTQGASFFTSKNRGNPASTRSW